MEAGKTMNVRFTSASEAQKNVKKQENSLENIVSDLDVPINIIDE